MTFQLENIFMNVLLQQLQAIRLEECKWSKSLFLQRRHLIGVVAKVERWTATLWKSIKSKTSQSNNHHETIHTHKHSLTHTREVFARGRKCVRACARSWNLARNAGGGGGVGQKNEWAKRKKTLALLSTTAEQSRSCCNETMFIVAQPDVQWSAEARSGGRRRGGRRRLTAKANNAKCVCSV